jgi:colanic acid biosynthesis glycosyl transferase WcaI
LRKTDCMPHRTLLLISQVYVPDPASVGQHLHDAAVEIVRRSYPVRVLTSARGYDAPQTRFPPRETRDGVEIVRLPCSSFGKRSLLVRLAGHVAFLVQALWRGLWTPRLGAVLVSTVPPMCSLVGLLIAAVRRVPLVFWVMDINPDEAVALGLVSPRSPLVWLFNRLNRAALRRAHSVVTLDRFMAERLLAKHDVTGKLAVFPPWPHEDQLDEISHGNNPFRKRHHLDGRFVVMYSGNHSPVNPITTVLEAARRLAHREEILFLFVGGGACKREVDTAIAEGARNIVSFPYQPLSELKYSLSAADAHVVSLGRQCVGIVHPCKIYGAMAVARPILAFGPRPSHISDLLERCDVGRRVEHGDVEGAIAAIVELAGMPPAARAAMGDRGRLLVRSELSKQALCERFGDILEAALSGRPRLALFRPGQETPEHDSIDKRQPRAA